MISTTTQRQGTARKRAEPQRYSREATRLAQISKGIEKLGAAMNCNGAAKL